MNAIGRQVKSGGSRSQHCGLFAVDVAGFTGSGRSDQVQHFLRKALYEVLTRAFDGAGIGWRSCHHEDRGDGVLVIAPAHMASATVIDPLLNRLQAGLRRHNRLCSEVTRIRLRVAVHSGEVHFHDYGGCGTALNHVFRLLDAPVLKKVLVESGGDLALIVSDYFYESVIRREPGLTDPAAFQPIRVAVKETRARAWLHLPQAPASLPSRQPENASRRPWSATTPSGPHETRQRPVDALASPHSHSDQTLDAILAAAEAKEIARIQAGLNLDAGLAAIMQDGSRDQMPATHVDDSGEPQILAEVASNPSAFEILPFRWVRNG